MQITGTKRIGLARDAAIKALHEPETLALLFPGKAEVTMSDFGTYGLVFKKNLDLFEMTQRGTLTLLPQGDDCYRMAVKASHMLAGSVDMTMDIVFKEGNAPSQTNIQYEGTLEATGLARRLLHQHEHRVETAVSVAFNRLKARLETQA